MGGWAGEGRLDECRCRNWGGGVNEWLPLSCLATNTHTFSIAGSYRRGMVSIYIHL